MAVDWLGFAYAMAVLLGGIVGYKRKGSVMSLIAGLLFGSLSAYGSLGITTNPSMALLSSGSLAAIMGLRYWKSGKLIPAVMAGLSTLMFLRLLLLLVL
ncbi:transmembrane protein 14C [Brienomyrus brachyistius]|uniref:transmembrane protein 14C n=1 Tax=Brienomyrus brachyistius TaxID=42636 RepID=UPI0020B17E84|nr:transmembrane protein 14C [Brienomyrus brachyistius]XP_048865698.1 transmembrane protein 14C [Brienomyrus brachyistius]XP_048865699.1 transmembrane protein 14C [Brienomyrus brachyistius]